MISHSSMTTFILCSMRRIASPNSPWTRRMISMICTSSSGFIPAVGSSNNNILGSVASARAISTLLWAPYGRLRTT